MYLQQQVINQTYRREVKYRAVNYMALAGVLIATVAILCAKDQAAMFIQITNELSQTSLGTILTSLTSYF